MRLVLDMKINENYLKLKDSYLFTDINRRVKEYVGTHPDADIIRLGIGDVTLPLAPAVVEAMKQASDEMGNATTFRGYGPEQGYLFLREAISNYYAAHGVKVSPDEILVSDGAKSDLGNILDIFAKDNIVLIPDPVYPVYVDTNIMDGREIVYMAGSRENGFLPMPDNSVNADIIYLCSPNNPTGAVYTREQLAEWVKYANEHDSVILFDAAYEGFIGDNTGLPRSIYEIQGAETCAIEFCSLSKTAGFTGTRCGYTVLPDALVRGGVMLRKLWLRRQTTKFNGTSYIIQRGAAAALSPDGIRQCRANIEVYKRNAAMISDMCSALGWYHTGGKCSPYIWLECPNKMGSWEFFGLLLDRANVVGTPGAGFGTAGEGFFRLTGFGSESNTARAVGRIKEIFG